MSPSEAPTNPEALQLGQAARARREHLGMTQNQAAQAAGLAPMTWRAMEAGRRADQRPLTLAGVDRALGWPHGTARAILDGGAPPAPAEGNATPNASPIQPGDDLKAIWAKLNEMSNQLDAILALTARGPRP